MFFRRVLTTAVIVFFFWKPSFIHASENFYTSLSSTYEIAADGSTRVSKKFQIANKKSTIYLKKYGIELSSNRISEVKVFDDRGTIPANITQTDNKTTIGLEFPDVDDALGKDSARIFTVEYLDPDTAIAQGKVLEVHIPRLNHPEEFDEYQVSIKVPNNFTQPAISKPEDFSIISTDRETQLNYSSTLSKNGISALFGQKQNYSFQLNYDLDNPSQSQGTVQIALPPDTQYQKIFYQTIDPPPQQLHVDEDGNWIATYQIDSNEKRTISATGIATVFLTPQQSIPIRLPNKKLSQTDQYWEVNDEKITNLAKQYTTPKAIFDFVSQNLQYNYKRLEDVNTRLGAAQALEDPNNAVCQEFSDLFITLARANHIPARQIIGYALTNNPQIRPLGLVRDILHSWPEYFDSASSTWKPVDPTWTNTTGGIDYFTQLDFNHLAFVIQGQSSQKPYPPGSYKNSAADSKNVVVSVTTQEPNSAFLADVQISSPITSPLGLNNEHTVTIKNDSGIAWYNIPVHFSANEGISLSQNVYVIENFLPFETVTIPLHVTDPNSSTSHNDIVVISIENSTTRHTVKAGSRWSRWYSAIKNPFTAIILITVIIAVVIITAVIVFQSKGKKKK